LIGIRRIVTGTPRRGPTVNTVARDAEEVHARPEQVQHAGESSGFVAQLRDDMDHPLLWQEMKWKLHLPSALEFVLLHLGSGGCRLQKGLKQPHDFHILIIRT
jgi:hypothetical protein